jgi:hypothetical protein
MRFTEAEKRKYRDAGDLLRLLPVTWPLGENVMNDADHYSGNTVTLQNDTLMVWYVTRAFHFGGAAGKRSLDSWAGFTRSTDGGETWSPLRRIDHELGELEGRISTLGWGGFNTVVGDDAVIVSPRGIYRSSDSGMSWEAVPNNLDELTPVGTWNHEPCYHPDKGLLILGNLGNDRIGLQNNIAIKYSKDLENWEEEVYDLPENIVPAEPTATYHDGNLVFVTRNGSNGAGWPYAQMFSTKGWFPMQHYGETDITQTYQTCDNTSLIYNPVSGRYECVAGNRGGGGRGHEDEHVITVNLFSIAPDDLFSGDTHWRFDGTLIKRQGKFGDIDGHYPAGVALDLERQVQYICVWMGVPSDKSAVFLVERTLDTDALRDYLLPRS